MAKLSATLVLFLGLSLSGRSANACTNRAISEVLAPGGATRAALFERDCGATTGFSTQISIVGRGGRLSGSGNTFVADDDHGATATASWGGPWAEMAWTSPTHLVIRYDEKARVFKSAGQVGAVSVSFEKIAAPRPPISERCFRDTQAGSEYIGDRACIRFDPPRLFTGVWIVSFEESEFEEGVNAPLRGPSPGWEPVWLTIDRQSIVPPNLRQPHWGHVYKVKFIGRPAHDMHCKAEECYGHLGGARGLILVNRMLEASDLGALRRDTPRPKPGGRRPPPS